MCCTLLSPVTIDAKHARYLANLLLLPGTGLSLSRGYSSLCRCRCSHAKPCWGGGHKVAGECSPVIRLFPERAPSHFRQPQASKHAAATLPTGCRQLRLPAVRVTTAIAACAPPHDLSHPHELHGRCSRPPAVLGGSRCAAPDRRSGWVRSCSSGLPARAAGSWLAAATARLLRRRRRRRAAAHAQPSSSKWQLHARSVTALIDCRLAWSARYPAQGLCIMLSPLATAATTTVEHLLVPSAGVHHSAEGEAGKI